MVRYWVRTDRAHYDVGADGRFLMLEMPDERQGITQINVILNWFEELKERVPTGR